MVTELNALKQAVAALTTKTDGLQENVTDIETVVNQIASGGGGNGGNVLDGIVRWEFMPTLETNTPLDLIVFPSTSDNSDIVSAVIRYSYGQILINGKRLAQSDVLATATLPTGVRMTLRVNDFSGYADAKIVNGLVGFYN